MGHPWNPKGKSRAVDMTGWKRDGWEVIEKAGNFSSSATWRARHSCGAVHVMLGTTLRNLTPKYCPTCRPRKVAA